MTDKPKLPEKIDTSVIRGQWVELNFQAYPVNGGDDTEKSIKLVAEKINTIISYQF